MSWEFQPSSHTFVRHIPSLGVEFHLQEYSAGINFGYFVQRHKVIDIPKEVSFRSEGATVAYHHPQAIPLLVMSHYDLFVNGTPVLELRRPKRPTVVPLDV